VAAAAGGRVLTRVQAHLLLSSGWATGVATLGEMGTGEVTLATQGLGILLLTLAVLTKGTDGSRRELASARCVGVVQSRLVARDAQGLGATVLGEATALADGLSSKRVIGDGARGLLDGLLVGSRIGGDLGAAGAVRKRGALEIHGVF